VCLLISHLKKVCIYLYMYVYIYLYVYINICIWNVRISYRLIYFLDGLAYLPPQKGIYVYTYIYIEVCTHVWKHMYRLIYENKCVYIDWLSTRMGLLSPTSKRCIFVCLFLLLQKNAYIHLYMHIYTHNYIFILFF
jgi:hypothetical protein